MGMTAAVVLHCGAYMAICARLDWAATAETAVARAHKHEDKAHARRAVTAGPAVMASPRADLQRGLLEPGTPRGRGSPSSRRRCCANPMCMACLGICWPVGLVCKLTVTLQYCRY